MLTQKRLKELLHYDPDTGIFTWIVSRGTRVKVGEVAGYTSPEGYVIIGVRGKQYKAHRLAFLYMEGYFPEHDVDHKKGVLHDNRWNSIRHSTHLCNMQNQAIYSSNTSGFTGVSWYSRNGMWVARSTLRGEKVHLGYYVDKLDAALAKLTWEVNCEQWTCNIRSNLVKAIKTAWPEFNNKCLGETK